MAELSGAPSGAGRRVAVIASRFNEEITRALVEGALDALVRHGAAFDDIDVLWVPGAWELPLAVRRAMETERYDAVIALGAVIRGETPHFDYISAEASRGLADAARDSEIPVGFGLLTCNDMDQARARAGGEHGNKGWDAAVAALEMADLMQQLDVGDES
jgi:6,7-dimethyl-8-ribityllumazine synthase